MLRLKGLKKMINESTEDNGGFILSKEHAAKIVADMIIRSDIFLATFHPEKHKMPTEESIKKIINDCRKSEGLDAIIFDKNEGKK